MDDYLSGWLQSDATRSDAILVRRVFIDILDGNLVDALLFAQIVYWHSPDKQGKPRLNVEREGHLWLAKSHEAWWAECRVPERTARNSIQRMRTMGLIETRAWHFQGRKMLHLRIVPGRFRELVEAANNGESVEADTPAAVCGRKGRIQPDDESMWPERPDISGRKGQMHVAGEATYHLYNESEITSKTTPETTSSSSADLEEKRAQSSPAPPPSDDDETFLDSELENFGFSQTWRTALLEQGEPLRILGLLLTAQERATSNPAGLLITMLDNDQQPDEEFLERARLALVARSTDPETIERHRRAQEAEQLNARHAAPDEEQDTEPLGDRAQALTEEQAARQREVEQLNAQALELAEESAGETPVGQDGLSATKGSEEALAQGQDTAVVQAQAAWENVCTDLSRRPGGQRLAHMTVTGVTGANGERAIQVVGAEAARIDADLGALCNVLMRRRLNDLALRVIFVEGDDVPASGAGAAASAV